MPEQPTAAPTEPDVLPDVLQDHDEPSADVPKTSALRFARMAGSSIAAPDAAPWVTDFLNAAYFRRPVDERDPDDLRLAFSILTTHWYAKGGDQRLHLPDLAAFHRAYGRQRLSTDGSARGVLSREELLDGAAELIGDWFADAYADDERRASGIAFRTVADREAYDPDRRLRLARLGALTPESGAPQDQVWHTYPPVAMPSVQGVVDALTRPETWPDYASEIGRFTPLRSGGLLGQTFEIEVAAGTGSGRPIFTRGYVTITDLVTPDDPAALAAWVGALEDGLARYGDDEPTAVPEGGTAVVGLDLTTHQGHFMGNGHNRLLLFTLDGQAYVRAAGTWDPMPWHITGAYKTAGKEAQHAFWGQGEVERLSMLHQLAKRLEANVVRAPTA